MKKLLFGLFIFILFIPLTYALEYSCSIESEEDYITSYVEGIDENDLDTYMNISISNIDNIDSLRMYVKYDKNKYDIKSCSFLNYTTSTCSSTNKDESVIFYDYKYSDSYKLKDYPFYYVSFISNKNTPVSGNTKVEVYFEEAKDKNGNKININGCSKLFIFKESDLNIINDSVISSEVPNDFEDYNVTINGYEFKFDKEKYDYELKVEKDVNALDIKVDSSDEYTYTLTGATDLSTYGNKVTIVFMNSNNEELTYTINIIKDKEEVKENTDIKEKIKEVNYKKYIPIVIGVIVIIVIISLIVKKLTSRKIDKYLDNL